MLLTVIVTVSLATSSWGQAVPPKPALPAPSSKLGEKTVTIEVRAAAIGDVLRQLFELAGEKGVFSEVDGTARKLTAMLKNVPFELALDHIATAAGLKTEKKDGTWILTIPVGTIAYGPSRSSFGAGSSFAAVPAYPMVTTLSGQPLGSIFEAQSHTVTGFRCGSCEKTASFVVSKPKPSACAKCNRALQPEWEFCPGCGDQRATPATFAFCPFCGKGAKSEVKRAVTDAELLHARAQLEVAAAALAQSQARLTKSQGKLLREQNELAVAKAAADLAAARAMLRKLEDMKR